MKNKITPLLTTNIPALKLCNRGKVRDMYEINSTLLIIATDRISAFDVVLPSGIPYKGQVLTGLSEFWFKYTSCIIKNHLITTHIEHMGNPVVSQHKDILTGRSMLAKKVKVVPVECVVRGYLAGSGWKEYKKTQSICGINSTFEPVFNSVKKSKGVARTIVTEIIVSIAAIQIPAWMKAPNGINEFCLLGTYISNAWLEQEWRQCLHVACPDIAFQSVA